MSKNLYEKVVYGLPNYETKFSPYGRVLTAAVNYNILGIVIYRKRSSNTLELSSQKIKYE